MLVNSYPADIKAILFDCDGTLVNSEPAHHSAWHLALQELGYEYALENYEQYVGMSDQEQAQRLAEKIGTDCQDILLEKKSNHYHKLCLAGLTPIEPTVNFLKCLAKEKDRLGIKIGICSAATKIESEYTRIHNLSHANLQVESFADMTIAHLLQMIKKS